MKFLGTVFSITVRSAGKTARSLSCLYGQKGNLFYIDDDCLLRHRNRIERKSTLLSTDLRTKYHSYQNSLGVLMTMEHQGSPLCKSESILFGGSEV